MLDHVYKAARAITTVCQDGQSSGSRVSGQPPTYTTNICHPGSQMDYLILDSFCGSTHLVMKNQMVDDETGKAVEDENQPKSKAGAGHRPS